MMIEPIMELVDVYRDMFSDRTPFRERVKARTAIESAVAELRARAERAEQLNRDYEEVNADKKRLVRDLDVAMHGDEGAAQQASLCDLIVPAQKMKQRIADFEAEKRAYLAAGKALANAVDWSRVEHGSKAAFAAMVIDGQPGALAAWQAKGEK